MLKHYKILIVVLAFFASASVAWASFNYNSANNYFLFNQQLNLGLEEGSFILVGNRLDGTPDSLSVSNNLIFSSSDGILTDGKERFISKDVFSTKGIKVANDAPKFIISTPGGTGNMYIKGENIFMNNNLRVSKGMVFDVPYWTNVAADTIYAERATATNFGYFSANTNKTLIPTANLLKIAQPAGGTAEVKNIIFDNTPFCTIKRWDISEDASNNGRDRTGGNPFDADVPADFEGCKDTGADLEKSRRSCCDPGYLVFSVDAAVEEYTTDDPPVQKPYAYGQMVCCRFSDYPINFDPL